MSLPINKPPAPSTHLSYEENERLWKMNKEYMKQLESLPPTLLENDPTLIHDAKREHLSRGFTLVEIVNNKHAKEFLDESDITFKNRNCATGIPMEHPIVPSSQPSTKVKSTHDNKNENQMIQRKVNTTLHNMCSSLLSISFLLKLSSLLFSVALIYTAHDKFTRTACPCHNKRIHVKVCTEALCPGCKEFVLHQVIPTYQTLGDDDVMDLHLVPFGNAIFHEKNKTATCQHGLGECDANTWEQCLIAVYPNPSDYLQMLECLENVLPMGSHPDTFAPSIFEKCAQQAQLAFSKIQDCHDNADMTFQLLQKAAKETPNEHTHVPWAIVDGTHMDEEHDDLLQVVCKAFVKKGGTHPACNKKKHDEGGLLRGRIPTSVV